MMKPSRYHTTLFQRIVFRMRCQPRGQSFVELMLVVVILALLLSGVVEFGFLLNQYLHVLDGAREAARVASNDVPFYIDGTGKITDYYRSDFYYLAANRAASTMTPVTLNPDNPDDIVISVFSVSSGSMPVRFPLADPNGWSLCHHYAAYAAYISSNGGDPGILFPGWSSGCTVRSSQLGVADVRSHMDASAPSTGVVVVEIYYNYPQLLKLPVLTSVLADPVPLYAYAIMPLSSASPTATGIPPH